MEQGIHLRVVETTGSTNNDLKKDAAAPSGTALIALRQTEGRGRLGRRFESPGGGVYFSLLLHPKASPEKLLHLTAMAAVALRRGIQKLCGLSVGIKWTNDLVCRGKKLCGILTELVTEGDETAVIIGVGLNCNGEKEDFSPELREMSTSLKQLTGRCFEPVEVAKLLLGELWQMSERLFTEKAQWLQEYESACVTVGRQVRVLQGGTEEYATAVGIDENGGLLLRYEDGRQTCVNTGEVSVRGMYGYSE